MVFKNNILLKKIFPLIVLILAFFTCNADARIFERGNTGINGAQANNESMFASISRNGLYIVFSSLASNLVSDDTNNTFDIFVYNRVSGEVQRVGPQGNNASLRSAISSDGRYIAFVSRATNLVLGEDSFNSDDVFIRDTVAGTTTLVSISPNGLRGGSHGGPFLGISDDGKLVAFSSQSNISDLDTDLDGACDENCDSNGSYTDVFIRDMNSGVIKIASLNSEGKQANGNSTFSSMSSDGRFVVFYSAADNLAGSDTNGSDDVFIRDFITGKTACVSIASDGTVGNSASNGGKISADGRYVAFASSATNLVLNDLNERIDIFVHDRATGKTERVSIASDGTEADGDSLGESISSDGRFISFVSSASNLVQDDSNMMEDIFVHDRVTGETKRISISTDGAEANLGSFPDFTSISGDGQLVVFDSSATNLVLPDTNGLNDIFTAAQGYVQLIQSVFNRTKRSDGKAGYSLVAGKDLVIRAFFGVPSGSSGVEATGELCVDGDVATCAPAKLFKTEGKLYPIGTIFTDAQRLSAENSLNFFITKAKANEVLTAGAHTFNIRILPKNIGGFDEITSSAEAIFQDSKGIDIYLYPVRLKNSAGELLLPDSLLVELGSGFVRSTYPVDEEKVRNLERSEQPFSLFPSNTSAALGQAQLRITLDIKKRLITDWLFGKVSGLKSEENIFGAGVVANLVDGKNSIGYPDSDGLLGYTYPSIKGVVITLDRSPKASPDNIPLIGSTIAHELGHQLKFGEEYCYDNDDDDVLDNPCKVNGVKYRESNPPPQSKYEGNETGNYITEQMGAFDIGEYILGRKALFGPPGTPVFSYMGGGNDANSWTSQVEYEFLYKKLTTEQPQQQTPREVVSILGIVNQDGTATLESPVIGISSADLPDITGSTYSVEFSDSSGNLLDSIGFDLLFEIEQFFTDSVVVANSTAVPFSISSELPAGTQTITLMQGANMLGQISRSPNKPEIIINSIEIEGENLTVSWSANDLDGDSLLSTLFYSPDGDEQQAVVVGITDTSWTFNLNDVQQPSEGAQITVYTTDGFNYAQDSVEIDLPSVTIVKSGTGSGKVTSLPLGIDCGSDCTESFVKGSGITITASADPDSIFSGWQGTGCDKESECSITVTSDTVITAVFDKVVNTGNLPDLKPGLVNTPQRLKRTGRIKISAYVKNTGKSDTTSSKMEFYLSQDKTLSINSGDIFIGEKELKGLKKKKSRRVVLYKTLPLGITAGSYYIKVFLDSGNVIAESDEANNIGVSKRIRLTEK